MGTLKKKKTKKKKKKNTIDFNGPGKICNLPM